MGVEFSSFRFKASLDEEMDEADLIISHCGAGSILEAVSRRKPLIVVINESLQDNHQREIANAIVSEGYGLAATPQKLLKFFNRFLAWKELSVYLPRGVAGHVPQFAQSSLRLET
eukprot:gene29555-33242_t